MLRGINVGGARRISMARLRELLAGAGYANVATHGQSGNIVLDALDMPQQLADDVSGLIAREFGFEVPVTVRTHTELSAVIAHDPIPGGAQDPKRYQVTFLPQAPTSAALQQLHELAGEQERLAVHGRELYSYHPDGIARSKLAARLTHPELGASATVRNWTTVTALGGLTSRGSVATADGGRRSATGGGSAAPPKRES
jgi:uncharacterized protein (DUF1697 family)